jgi:hypothetical protein
MIPSLIFVDFLFYPFVDLLCRFPLPDMKHGKKFSTKNSDIFRENFLFNFFLFGFRGFAANLGLCLRKFGGLGALVWDISTFST